MSTATLAKPRRKSPKHHTIKQEWQVIGLTKDHCQREIAEITGIGKSTVHHIQHKYHLTLSFGQSSSSSHFAKRFQWDEWAWGILIEHFYVHQRMSIKATAKIMGVNPSTLSKRMRVLGIESRYKRKCK